MLPTLIITLTIKAFHTQSDRMQANDMQNSLMYARVCIREKEVYLVLQNTLATNATRTQQKIKKLSASSVGDASPRRHRLISRTFLHVSFKISLACDADARTNK